MQHFLLDLSLGICFSIYGKAYPEIKGLTASVNVKEDTDDTASVNLLLFEPRRQSSFAQVQIEMAEFTLEKTSLSIQVFAEIDKTEIKGLHSFTDVNLEQIFQDYKHLKPLVKEGISHYIDDRKDPKNPTRGTSRSLKVRYKTYEETIEEDENYMFDFDKDEIAALTLPYILSLLDIHSKYTVDFEPDET